MNLNNQKLDIIILAGQSNAEGNGLSHGSEEPIIFSKDAYELVDWNEYYFKFEEGKEPELILTMPCKAKLQPLQERMVNGVKIADLSLSFVKDYIDAGLLEEDRKILVVKAAVGGTGFAKKQQGVGNVIYERLLQMTEQALSLSKDCRIVALLWHQGEHDAYENAELTSEERKAFYIEQFMTQMNDYRNKHNKFSFPIITGGFAESWKKLYVEQTKAVEEALQISCEKLGNADFVSSSGLLSNDDVLKNGDNIHFSRECVLELGHRYFNKYKELIK